MGNRHARRIVIGALCVALVSPAVAFAQSFGSGYDRGYREGVQQGERDGRDGRDPRAERNSVYRDGDRGYQSRYGSRDAYVARVKAAAAALVAERLLLPSDADAYVRTAQSCERFDPERRGGSI